MRKILNLFVTLLFAAITLQSSAATFVGDRDDFRDETIYFVITTRFYDGDQSNNTYCWDGTLNQDAHDPEWRGDFKGLIEKLDYIKALGFTAVWITPVVENASGLDYHGYHAFDFSKVDPRYESDDVSFQTLIDEAHNRDMKIILDIVLNHTGNFGEANLCPMFAKDYDENLGDINASLKLCENSRLTEDYFDLASSAQYSARLAEMKNTDGTNHDTHNYWHHFGSFNWDDYTRWYAQIAGDCVDLNTENPAVAAYLLECYGTFIKMGVDGFRIDTSGHIPRLTFNKAFIPQFTELAETYKSARNGGPFFMFGEVCARYTQVTYRGQKCLSPYYYTWAESTDYDWTYDESSWDDIVVMEGDLGDHTNINSTLAQNDADANESNMPNSDNVFLDGNDYHTPDYSDYSGFSVIDFPMHWNFDSAEGAFGIRSGDCYYNDASYNVVYVDSHDYAPDNVQNYRFNHEQSVWAENLDLMFTFRGIPCLYYGSEIEFKKGCVIDDGTNTALINTGRAYFGGYIKGDVTVSDFAEYSNASGNMAASLTYPLSLHIQRLNKIRAAIPALRKGQYSTDGCSGSLSFKRRFTDSTTDSYVLVTISGNSTFTDIENGTYVDAITGDEQTVTNNTLTVSCSGTANMRVYVLDTDLTPAPGKIGDDGKYLYSTSSVTVTQESYDGTEEEVDDETEIPDSSSSSSATIEEPDEATAPYLDDCEQAIFFDNSGTSWSGYIRAWIWNSSDNFTGGSWPGEKCTYLGDGIWKWSYSGTDEVSGKVIFNNASSQTDSDGFTYVNGGVYTSAGLSYTVSGCDDCDCDYSATSSSSSSSSSSSTQNEDGTYTWTVYFDNSSSSWSSIYVWIWDSSNSDNNYTGGSWPGTTMTYDSESGYWVYTFTTNDNISSPKVIFNCGSSSCQTDDLTLVNNGIYTYSAGYTNSVVDTDDSDSSPVSDIEANAAQLKIYASNGTLVIISSEETTVTITNIAGVTRTLEVHAGTNYFRNLTKGFYIVNRTKVLL